MKKKKKVKRVARKKKPSRKTKKKKVAMGPKKKVVKRKKAKAGKPKKKTSLLDSIPRGASLEEVGVVTHYFPHVEAAVVKVTGGSLSVGDTIIIKGHTTEFKEKINSIQLEHASITKATTGQEIGLGVTSKVRDHDVVYKIVG